MPVLVWIVTCDPAGSVLPAAGLVCATEPAGWEEATEPFKSQIQNRIKFSISFSWRNAPVLWGVFYV